MLKAAYYLIDFSEEVSLEWNFWLLHAISTTESLYSQLVVEGGTN